MNYFRSEKSSSNKYYQANGTNKAGLKKKTTLILNYVKIKHNVHINFIAGLFTVPKSSISVTITPKISLLAIELKFWLIGLHKSSWKNSFEFFTRNGNNVCAIINASELQTERPLMTNAKAVVKKNKQRHTFKVPCIVCTPGRIRCIFNGNYVWCGTGATIWSLWDVQKRRQSFCRDGFYTNKDEFLIKKGATIGSREVQKRRQSFCWEGFYTNTDYFLYENLTVKMKFFITNIFLGWCLKCNN